MLHRDAVRIWDHPVPRSQGEAEGPPSYAARCANTVRAPLKRPDSELPEPPPATVAVHSHPHTGAPAAASRSKIARLFAAEPQTVGTTLRGLMSRTQLTSSVKDECSE